MILDVGGERCDLDVDDDDNGGIACGLVRGVDDDLCDHGELGVDDYNIIAMLATLE